MGRLLRSHTLPEPGRCVWAYPVAGLVVGGLGSAVFFAGHAAGLPPALVAAWTMGALLLLTGAIHEDGLADTADGFGGGRTVARKLEIMRDSRIGSYGALALLFSLGTRGAALAALREPAAAVSALIATGALGRSAMGAVAVLLRPARPDGLGAALHRPPLAAGVAGLALGVGPAALTLPGRAAFLATLASAAAAGGVAVLAKRQVGGHTGDILGASEQAAECAALTVLAATLPV